MKADEKSFRRDEIVFREGDVGDAIYVVARGRVEVLKSSPDGPVIIASLGPGEMFGEMGVLDDRPRNASAVCIVDAVLKVVPKHDFRAWVKQDPEAADRVIKLLMDRLRLADEVVARSHSTAPPPGYLVLLHTALTWLRRLRHRHDVPTPGPASPAFAVGVATINNDIEGAWGRALLDLFEGQNGLSARPVSATLALEPNPDQAQANAATLKARQALAREDGLDLLIWGDVHADGFTLYFTPAGIPDEDRPGAFGPFLSLELAGDLAAPVGDVLALAALAAVEPVHDAGRALQRQTLPAALQALGDFVGSLPVGWNLEQQLGALVCYGHAAATVAGWDTGTAWYDQAEAAYRAAIGRLPTDEHGLARAMLHKYLGGVLVAKGEKSQDMAVIEQAVEAFRVSAECLVRGAYPQEWAAAQNRLGLTLYKLDHLTSQPDLLKEALGAFQGALQVFTRAEAPLKWADTMFNLAEVLLVYGDQVKNTEVLERAIEAARAALDHRSRERNPAAWAAGQNTLGTALFLLDKHGRSALHVEEAKAALSMAAETYRSLGLERQAKVAEKNLAHVEKLPPGQTSRKPAGPEWARDGG